MTDNENNIRNFILEINERYNQFKKNIIDDLNTFKSTYDLTNKQLDILKPSFEDYIIDPTFIDNIFSINPTVAMTMNNKYLLNPPFYKADKIIAT